MDFVTVYNGSGQDHVDRFDGKDYSFPSGGTVTVPAEAALHIFGMGLRDRQRQIVRLGWARTGADVPKAIERLDSFLFERAVMPEDDDPPKVSVARRIEKPTEVPAAQDALLNSVKSRTRSILQKAS
jgi:hypothetical protein